MEEKPTSSAVNATRVIVSYASTGSSIPANSFIGPCGRITPNVNDICSLFSFSFSNDMIIYIIVLVRQSQANPFVGTRLIALVALNVDVRRDERDQSRDYESDIC
jgi:hypothetical protein